MSNTLTPSAALSPEAFYSLYLGGLTVEAETARLEISYTLLLLGRLGLAPDELLHLHEGWIDWKRGEIHVPARDPCACSECWNRARRQQRAGDSRELEAIVAEDCWTPSSERGARRLAFGWSQRLTAVLDGVLDTGAHLESDHSTVSEHIEHAATMARHVDPADVSVPALRASALSFLASAGFGPRRLADLTGVDEETAGEFARVGGGEMRSHLYRVLADVEAPALDEKESQYRIACNPEGFKREPFDPTEYDGEWRAERARKSERRERNLRTPAPPSDVSFSVEDLPVISEPAGESGPGIVADSLAAWVDQQERARGVSDSTEAGKTADSTEASEAETATGRADSTEQADSRTDRGDGGADNPLQVTEPVEFSIDTRLVAPGFEDGRPTGGSIMLGQEELLFLSREASGISDYLRVELDWVANLAPGYAPDPIEGLFDDTVGIAYRTEDQERRVVVAEIPSDIRWRFVQTIFTKILDGESAVVTHRPGQPTAIGPHERQMNTTRERIWLEQPAGENGPIGLRLKQLVDIEPGPMSAEEGYQKGLTVTHLQPNGELVTTEVRPTIESNVNILNQYLTHYDDRQTGRARRTPLEEGAADILEQLYDTDGSRDMVGMLDKDPETLASAMDHLEELGLVIDGSSGKQLTGVGYRLISPEYDL